MHRLRILLFCFALLCSPAAFPQVELSPSTTVSILTCDTGNEIYSLFGHTAIRIKDPATSLDVVYNYGAFDFRTPNFELKFARGDLQYFATAESFDDFMMQYTMEKRSVYQQDLNLTYDQKVKLFESLNEVLMSDKRFYTYKFIDRNCTNMAVAQINQVLGKPVIFKQDVTDATYRDIIFPYFKNHFYEQWGTSILFGTKVDEQATALFLPSEFMHSLKVTKYEGKPIASPAQTILSIEPEKPKMSWWNNVWTYLVVMALVIVFHKRRMVQTVYLSVIAVLGCLFAWTMLYSLHEELRSNYNILLFNPLLLILAYCNERKMRKTASVVVWTCFGFIAIYLMIVATKAHALIVLPIVIANCLILWRMLQKNR